jgi:hypothetical protein
MVISSRKAAAGEEVAQAIDAVRGKGRHLHRRRNRLVASRAWAL